MKRSERNKLKRKRKWYLLLIIPIVLVIISVYWVTQYNSGLLAASDGLYKDDGVEFDSFEGEEPELGIVNIVLIGSDARSEEGGLSDSLLIGHYNQKTNQIKLASLMRDIYVDIPNRGKQKINAAFSMGGPELVRKTIKENFDVDVHYYAVVDFKGFPEIIDLIAPTGIEVDIPYEMSHGIGMTLNPGVQTLHGNELLGYVRFRHDRHSDFGRVERQQEVLSKVKEKAVSVNNLVNLPKILGLTDPYVDTNVDKRTILSISKGLLVGKSKKVETLRIPMEGSFKNDRVAAGEILRIDFEENKAALKQFLSDSTGVSP